MNNYLLLAISMLCALGANVIKKHSTAKFGSKSSLRFFFNAAVSLSCVFVFLIISGIPEISKFTLLLGMLFGTVTALQFLFSLMSYENGPFSYTSVIVSLSTIIPALSGYLIWNEKIASIQIVGMALMLICFALSVDFSKNQKKASALWYVYVFVTFIATGFIGVMQKWHQSSEYKGELDGFLIVAFSCSFILSLIGFFFFSFKQNGNEALDSSDKKSGISAVFILLMVLCGVCAAANNKMNLYLSGIMDSAIFFPVVNGGGMILSTVTSIIFSPSWKMKV